ncbi:cell division protein FtsX [Benzoatithermus flavus]|uniref:Cell division transport system permease protein n=1 Tax=Benzoatithermus flavus TaxID=3108223 RepID=A0ABU8XN91_9PROT
MVRLVDLDLPIQDTPVSRFLAWIAGGLVFLAVIAVAVAIAADGTARRLALAPQLLTVVLPPATEATPADEVERVVAAAKQADGVAFARAVPAEELSDLVRPWLGPDAVASGLPMPRLVDVAFNPGREPDRKALASRLEALASGATVENLRPAHGEERARARTTAELALGAGLIAGAALLIVIAVVTRMGLDLHEETIDLLRLMGAPDRYVARQFEQHALGSVLRGGLLGFGAAVLTLLGCEITPAVLPARPLPTLGLAPLHWLLLGCAPVTVALLGALVARATARWRLARLR